jgi:hypothetical protein
MITCEEFFAEFGDYLENQVSEDIRREMELHLSQCRTCTVLYDSSCKTVRLVTDSCSFELPQPVSDAVVDRIMERLRSDRHDTK